MILLAILCATGTIAGESVRGTDQSKKTEPPAWVRIVLDEGFSNKGKVWKLVQDIYGDLATLSIPNGGPEDAFSIGAGFVEKAGGLSIEVFRTKHGEGQIEKTAKGVTYYCFGPLALGFKIGDKYFTWLRAPNRMFRDGFVEAAKKRSEPEGKQQLWRTSWTAFGQRLSDLFAAEVSLSALKTESKGDNLSAITPKSVQQEFDDVAVEWEGIVQEVFPPAHPGCRLAMKAVPLKFTDGSQLVLDSLKLYPLGDNKDSWKSVKVGDTVVFRTTLKGKGIFGVVVVMHIEGGFDKNLYGNGVSSGDTLLMISTEDAQLLKVKGKGPPKTERR